MANQLYCDDNLQVLRDCVASAKIGVFITLSDPTKTMQTEAVKAGFYRTPYGRYPKIQLLTIAELFAGKKPNIPLVDPGAFKKRRENRTPSSTICFHRGIFFYG